MVFDDMAMGFGGRGGNIDVSGFFSSIVGKLKGEQGEDASANEDEQEAKEDTFGFSMMSDGDIIPRKLLRRIVPSLFFVIIIIIIFIFIFIIIIIYLFYKFIFQIFIYELIFILKKTGCGRRGQPHPAQQPGFDVRDQWRGRQHHHLGYPLPYVCSRPLFLFLFLNCFLFHFLV
jgi:hypothetical protein